MKSETTKFMALIDSISSSGLQDFLERNIELIFAMSFEDYELLKKKIGDLDVTIPINLETDVLKIIKEECKTKDFEGLKEKLATKLTDYICKLNKNHKSNYQDITEHLERLREKTKAYSDKLVAELLDQNLSVKNRVRIWALKIITLVKTVCSLIVDITLSPLNEIPFSTKMEQALQNVAKKKTSQGVVTAAIAGVVALNPSTLPTIIGITVGSAIGSIVAAKAQEYIEQSLKEKDIKTKSTKNAIAKLRNSKAKTTLLAELKNISRPSSTPPSSAESTQHEPVKPNSQPHNIRRNQQPKMRCNVTPKRC